MSQYGLSAATTWQQLANQMVVSPAVGLGAGLQAVGQGTNLAASAAGLGQQQAENQYQSAMNQYGAQQAQGQQLAQLFNSGIGTGLQAYGAYNQGQYLNSLTGQGAQATLGGIPASSGYGAYNQSGGGYYQPGTTVYY